MKEAGDAGRDQSHARYLLALRVLAERGGGGVRDDEGSERGHVEGGGGGRGVGGPARHGGGNGRARRGNALFEWQ